MDINFKGTLVKVSASQVRDKTDSSLVIPSASTPNPPIRNCKQNSEKGMNFTCSADFKCLDGEPTSFLAETAADKTGWLDIADWNRDGLLDVMHVLGERDVRFWMSGFCWPALACSGKGTCRHAEGRCDCIQGHHMSDCSACSEGYYTPDTRT